MEVKHDQHMMVASSIIKKIVDFADVKPNETILEIGPGTGSLTREIANKAGKVIAVEIDPRFEPGLKKIKGVKVVIGNALEKINGLRFDKIIANLPYAICEPLMGKLIETNLKPAVLAIPKGFAEIIMSKESRTGIITRACFGVEIVLEVPRDAFEPEPKTDSVVVKLIPKAGNELQKEVLKRQKLKVKNAIIRALFLARKSTKNQAKKAIKTLKLNNNLLDKRLSDADLAELDTVLASLEKL